jgi:formate-dependent nitrite reductase membrane component NrfD
MLRVIKPQSPMSVGVWLLVGFNLTSDAAWVLRFLGRANDQRLLHSGCCAAADASDVMTAALGAALATYTGVLLGVSAIPVWAKNIRLLPFHFGVSGLASASSLLELVHEDPALRRVGIAAAAAETVVGALLELDRYRAQEPLKRRTSGTLIRLAGVLSGPVALAIRLLSGRSRGGNRAAAGVSLAGTLMTRFAWLEAGKQSAEDPGDALGLTASRPE